MRLSMSSRVGLLVFAGAVVTGTAFATDYLFTSNRTGGGAQGRRLTMSTKTVGPYTDVPCNNGLSTIHWSPGGASWGIARDYSDTDLVWASISSTNPADCGGSGSDTCVGAAWYDTSTGTLTRSYNGSWSDPGAVVPDVAAAYPDVVALEKRASGTIAQWDVTSGVTANAGGVAHLSQVDWIDGSLFAATETATTTLSCGDGVRGSLVIGEVANATPISGVTVARPGGAPGTASTKPEGVTVMPLTGGWGSTSCAAGSTHVIYVTDWCLSQFIAYSIDTSDPTPTPVEEGRVDLDASSAFTGDCHPSSVEWHSITRDSFVVCQSRDTILRIDTSTDPCAPAWASDEATLQFYDSGSNPSCSATPTVQDCTACEAHDVAYSTSVSPDWLFVALAPVVDGTTEGQVVAIEAADLTNQFLFYRDAGGTYSPLELEVTP